MSATFLDSISDIDAHRWDVLFPGGNPFIRHAFLKALEDSTSVGGTTGWQPRHLLLRDGQRLLAAMPLYLKMHSYGEFVFDWSWAHAYEQHGLDYYPKLVTAIPFTPSTGPRIGLAEGAAPRAAMRAIMAALREQADDRSVSGWHLLFPDRGTRKLLDRTPANCGLLDRRDVQFHWHNRGYGDFDAYLGELKSSRRKNLRRERRVVAEQGVELQRVDGPDIGAADWRHFYLCYVSTYFKRSGHGGYLTQAFFDRLLAVMPEQLMLVMARQAGEVVASALFLHDGRSLYGRYWGALSKVHCLHFEACFYQGIEYCIERGLERFDPGTQGEHKLLRGFEPVTTHSVHWIADARFRAAIGAYLDQERPAKEAYGVRAETLLPFKK